MQTIASVIDDESPSIKRTGCWLTASGGDSRESATEINRQTCLVRMERWCKRPPLDWRWSRLCKPHLMQGQKGIMCLFSHAPNEPLESVVNGRAR